MIMKKLFISCILALTVGMLSAQSFNRVVIVLASGSQNDEVSFIEAPEFSDAFENGYDEMKMINSLGMNIYAVTATGQQSKVFTNDIRGTKLGVKAKDGVSSYTITFKDLIGTGYKFLDNENDSIFDITTTATYAFTMTAGATLDNRFEIYKPFTPDAGDLNICHQYGKLTINNNPYTTNIVVKNSSDVVVIDKAPRNTPQVIDLAALPAGRYTVEIGGQTLIIDVK